MENNTEKKSFFKSNIFVIIVTSFITFMVLQFIAQPAIVIGESMEPTLHNGNIKLLEKIDKNYKQFDIVVLRIPGHDYYVKRIIGCPGDTVQIIDGYAYVNGSKIDDVVDIKMEYAGIAESEIKLNENEYFVLGDNRNNSNDSRFENVGAVNEKYIKGKISFI